MKMIVKAEPKGRTYFISINITNIKGKMKTLTFFHKPVRSLAFVGKTEWYD